MSKRTDSEGVKNFEFFITTQADHDVDSVKSSRISEIRSYLASRGHDQRRRGLQARKFQESLHRHHSDGQFHSVENPAKRLLRPKRASTAPSASCNSSYASAYGVSPYPLPSLHAPMHISSHKHDSQASNGQNKSMSQLPTRTAPERQECRDGLLAQFDYSTPLNCTSDLSVDFDNSQAFTSPTDIGTSSSTGESGRWSSPNSSVPLDSEDFAITEIQSALDPFVQLPVEISIEERSLIHFCEYPCHPHTSLDHLANHFCRSSCRPAFITRHLLNTQMLSSLGYCKKYNTRLSNIHHIPYRHCRVTVQSFDSTPCTPALLSSL